MKKFYKLKESAQIFVCKTDGVIEIIEGSDAMSIDCVVGDKFEITPNYQNGEDNYRYYGKLISSGNFKWDAGLSGKSAPRGSSKPNLSNLIVAIQKDYIGSLSKESDFWATWE